MWACPPLTSSGPHEDGKRPVVASHLQDVLQLRQLALLQLLAVVADAYWPSTRAPMGSPAPPFTSAPLLLPPGD